MSVNPDVQFADGRRDRRHFSREHYAEMGRRGGKRTLRRYGRAHLAEIGAQGGLVTAMCFTGSPASRRWGHKGKRAQMKGNTPRKRATSRE